MVLSGSPTARDRRGARSRRRAGTFARLDPEPRRTVVNEGDEVASVLIVSAPRTSGYEPMEWA